LRAASASAATPTSELADQTNPYESNGPTTELTTEPSPEFRPPTRPRPRDQPPEIAGDKLGVETEEDYNRLDNDLLSLPPKPDYKKILFSPETDSAFRNPASHAQTLGMVKELLQQKELIAKVRYDERVRVRCSARRYMSDGNMPEGLKEFHIHLIPGTTPEQGARRNLSSDARNYLQPPWARRPVSP
jgi:hypothetical protein